MRDSIESLICIHSDVVKISIANYSFIDLCSTGMQILSVIIITHIRCTEGHIHWGGLDRRGTMEYCRTCGTRHTSSSSNAPVVRYSWLSEDGEELQEWTFAIHIYGPLEVARESTRESSQQKETYRSSLWFE